MSKAQIPDLSKVAVLLGGKSAEREVSLMSGQAVLHALQRCGINAIAFDPTKQNLCELAQSGVTAAFIALHGRYGEDGTVQGSLELMGIPYTGPGVMASSIAIDKHMTKLIWQAHQLPTPRGFMANNALDVQNAFEQLRLSNTHMIVKPALEGSSLGLTKVRSAHECVAAFVQARRLAGKTLCEALIEGDEVTCAVLEQKGVPQALPLIRIAAPDGNYDFQNKYYTDEVKYHVPSGLPPSEEQHIQALALRAYEAIGCRGWARVDVMIERSSREPYLLEINTSPGMTSHSLVPLAAKAVGIDFDALCLQVLKCARLDHDTSSFGQTLLEQNA